MFEAPANRRTWAPHGVDGWYIGTAPKHYRCYQVYIPKTRAEHTSKTVQFFPHQCPVPKTSSNNADVQATCDLTHALLHPAPATPFAKIGVNQMDAIQHLATIFNRAVPTFLSTPASSPRVPIVSLMAPIPAPLTLDPAPVPRVTPGPPPGTFSPAPNILHIIEPDPDKVVVARIPPRYHLRSKRPLPPLTQCIAHHIAATLPTEPTYPHALPGSSSRYVTATRLLLADEAACTASANNSVTEKVTVKSLEYCHLLCGPNNDVWTRRLSNDLGILAQGFGTRIPTGTNTVIFVRRRDIPIGRKVMDSSLVLSIRPHKTETHRVHVTVGGDKLDFPGITTTTCSSLTTTKCLINSMVSTPLDKFMTLDIINFYYNTPMEWYEYMKISLDMVPKEIIAQYQLCSLASDGWIFMEIRKGMPGMKKSVRISNDRLRLHLAKFGYAPIARTPLLWKHATKNIFSC